MEEITLRKVLSEKHNVRFDCCSAECANGDAVVHYGTLQNQHMKKVREMQRVTVFNLNISLSMGSDRP